MANKGWITKDYKYLVEVVPVDDTKEHFLGDECWCIPTVQIILFEGPRLVVHNSADRREVSEPDYLHARGHCMGKCDHSEDGPVTA